jgi:threonine dehydratase
VNNSISEDSIREAAERIKPLAKRTPVMRSDNLDERAGLKIYLKCENFQPGGAFKIRGASNMILALSPDELKQGVVAFSSGNHAQAVAIAAKYVGAEATIVMPEDAPKAKREATRAQGARIITYNRFTDDREAIAAALMKENGGTLVPPFDHPMVISGQGTAVLELMEEQPELDALAICVGGGGLLAGSATIGKALRPGIRVFGVEPEAGNDTFLSFAKGERVEIASPDTIADGLRSPMPGKITFPIVKELAEAILLVTDAEIKATMRFLMEQVKIVAEPSGVVGLGAVLFGMLPREIRSVGVVISGGNVDFDLLKTL